MQIFLRAAAAAALCAAVLLTGCAKKSTDQTTSTSTTTSTDTSPAAAAAAAPSPGSAAGEATAASAAPATPGTMSVTTSTGATAAGGVSGFIDLPVYPGAAENKDQALSMSANGTSVAVKVFSTKDDAKKVSDWYKAHLPAAWQSGVYSSGDKTVGTFSHPAGDGDQSVVVASDNGGVTRIQLTTKHGK